MRRVMEICCARHLLLNLSSTNVLILYSCHFGFFHFAAVMSFDKSRSNSGKMAREGFRFLGLPRDASINEINHAFKTKLDELQKRYADRPDRLISEGDDLYAAYRAAYLSKDGASEDHMLPLTLTGPDGMLNMFGIHDLPHQSLKVQMQAQAHYKDGQLVKKESTKTESFVNREGKRETKVFENGKLIQHTIDGKNMLK